MDAIVQAFVRATAVQPGASALPVAGRPKRRRIAPPGLQGCQGLRGLQGGGHLPVMARHRPCHPRRVRRRRRPGRRRLRRPDGGNHSRMVVPRIRRQVAPYERVGSRTRCHCSLLVRLAKSCGLPIRHHPAYRGIGHLDLPAPTSPVIRAVTQAHRRALNRLAQITRIPGRAGLAAAARAIQGGRDTVLRGTGPQIGNPPDSPSSQAAECR